MLSKVRLISPVSFLELFPDLLAIVCYTKYEKNIKMAYETTEILTHR